LIVPNMPNEKKGHMTFQQIDAQGIHYDTFIGVPDSPSSYVVEVIVSPEGKLKMQLGS